MVLSEWWERRLGLAVCWSIGSGSAPVGLSWLVMAVTIVVRTLNALSCFLRSDFAALGAFLWLLVGWMRGGLG
jgi:hypothetical protein